MAVALDAIYSVASGSIYGGRTSVLDQILPDFLYGKITVYCLNSTNYTIGWPAAKDNVGVTTYEYSVDGGQSWTSRGTALYADVTGRTPGTMDNVVVRAKDAAGNVSEVLWLPVTLPGVGAPTWVKSIIGIGGDYPNPDAWESATKVDLVSANNCHMGLMLNQTFTGVYSVGAITMNGAVTDATRYRHLTVFPGCSFMDHPNRRNNPLRVDATYGALVITNQGNLTTHCIGMHEAFCQVSRVQVQCVGNNTTGWGGYAIHSSSDSAHPTTLSDSIMEAGPWQFALSQNYGQIVRGCVVIQTRPIEGDAYPNGTLPMAIAEMNNGCQTFNTIFVAVGTKRFPRSTVARTTETLFRNCGFFGCDLVFDPSLNTTVVGTYGVPQYQNCFSDAPTLPSGVTFCLASDAFINGVVGSIGSHDLRLKPGSPLIGAGQADATNAPWDITGMARYHPTKIDVGPWQT